MSDLFDEIAAALARRTGSEPERVAEVIHAFFDGVERELIRGEKQSLPGLGQFLIKNGEVVFKPAKLLRDWLTENAIPKGPLPQDLLLNETQKSILANLETSYPDLSGEVVAGPVPSASKDPVLEFVLANEEKNPSPSIPVVVRNENAMKPAELPAGEIKSSLPSHTFADAGTSNALKETKEEDVKIHPQPGSPADEIKKLKLILMATLAGVFVAVVLVLAVVFIPRPVSKEIKFREVKVPVSETDFYRVGTPSTSRLK